MVERLQKGKITLGDLGAPALIKTLPPDKLVGGKYFVGSLMGKASGFVERTALKAEPGKEVMEGLSGFFRGIPSDLQRDEMESGVLFIPDAFHNLIATKLREAQAKDATAEVEFAFDAYSIPAKNPAGYSWELRPAIEMQGVDPLESLAKKMALLKDNRAKQIAAPSKK